MLNATEELRISQVRGAALEAISAILTASKVGWLLPHKRALAMSQPPSYNSRLEITAPVI